MTTQPDRQLTAQTAAYLYARGLSQLEIARQLGLSQSHVSRMLQEAELQGWLRTHVEFAAERVGESRLRQIEARLQPPGLAELICRSAPAGRETLASVRAFDSGSEESDRELFARRRRRFASLAAPHVAALIRRSRLVGVAWGSTTGTVVEALEELPLERAREGGPKFFPLCGEPMRHTGIRFSSSHLAAKLAELFRGGGEPAPSLVGVPALVPLSFSDAEVRVLKRLISRFDDHGRIFGAPEKPHDPDALIHRVETILTGAGRAAEALGHPEADALARGGEIDREQLSRLVFGDVCGVLLARPDLPVADRRTLDRIRQRWTGVDEPALAQCARRAVRNGLPGVIVFSIGKHNAEVVLETVRRGLVNHLVIDHELARSLQAILAAEDPAGPHQQPDGNAAEGRAVQRRRRRTPRAHAGAHPPGG